MGGGVIIQGLQLALGGYRERYRQSHGNYELDQYLI